MTPPAPQPVKRKPFKTLLIAAVFFVTGVAFGQGSFALPSLNSLRPGHDPIAKNLPEKLNYSEVDQVYKSLKENYDGQLNAQKLEEGLKHGLAEATGDPYTVYFTAKEAKEFQSQLNNEFSGIGAQLGLDKDGNVIIIAPIAGLPAEKAGVKPQDIIASINGMTTAGMSVDEAVSKIRGPKDTKVKLQLIRNRAKTIDVEITRQDIKLPSVNTKTLDGNIGYIQITSYANDTTELVQKAAREFKDKNVKGVVLDLRSNPGGLLESAVQVSSLWLPQGTKVLEEKRGGKEVIKTYSSLGGDILNDVPTVVLINQGSASASEITAGALKDNGAAYLIGEKSYGKGVVQQLVDFGDGSQLKVTIASWHRPNGQNINKKGITPDQIVKISEADAEAGKDPQLEAAQARLNR